MFDGFVLLLVAGKNSRYWSRDTEFHRLLSRGFGYYFTYDAIGDLAGVEIRDCNTIGSHADQSFDLLLGQSMSGDHHRSSHGIYYLTKYTVRSI